MLRPLEPIQWTLPVILARARDVTKRDWYPIARTQKGVIKRSRVLTLRQALRVLAKHGRRKMREAIEKAREQRWDYLVNCVTAAIHLKMNLRKIWRCWSAVKEVTEWARGLNVTIERIHSRIHDRAMHYRLTTTHLANPVTVELGVMGEENPGKVKIVMYPLRRETHLRFIDPLTNQPVESYPPAFPVMVTIQLDAARFGSPGVIMLIKDRLRRAGGQREQILYTVHNPHLPSLTVTLRTLLNLGGEQEEPLTPA